MKNKKMIILVIAIVLIIAVGTVVLLNVLDQINDLESLVDDLETEIIILNN